MHGPGAVEALKIGARRPKVRDLIAVERLHVGLAKATLAPSLHAGMRGVNA